MPLIVPTQVGVNRKVTGKMPVPLVIAVAGSFFVF